MTDPVTSTPPTPPVTSPPASGAQAPVVASPGSSSGNQNPLASIGNLQVARRLAALEAAFASLVELHFTHANDQLESARQWYEDFLAEHAPAADPPVGDVPVA